MLTTVRIKQVLSAMPAVYIAQMRDGEIRLRLDNSATMRVAPGPTLPERQAQLFAAAPDVERAARHVLETSRTPVRDGDTLYLSALDF
ncbi:hypothetical protein [Sphingomonas crocodyli]|uniref:Uncharacterized protein n=1 Tax=Sphingomonas crocodyli TaxID=1979270 RepID=A0A437LYC9_9SPHN|nr:hypothetical protein [Sphingomonas crocodyli]RVT90346.1 hypothetical protein EOD43_18950 [Sphingomonas crocodyli]